MKKQPKYSPEVIERAVRMVSEAASEYESQWAAIVSIASKIGCTPETLRRWVRQQERDTGQPEAGCANTKEAPRRERCGSSVLTRFVAIEYSKTFRGLVT
jgi:transposase-like protein